MLGRLLETVVASLGNIFHINWRCLIKRENTQSLSLQIEAGTVFDSSVSIKEITRRHVPKNSDFTSLATRTSNPVCLTSNYIAIIDETLE